MKSQAAENVNQYVNSVSINGYLAMSCSSLQSLKKQDVFIITVLASSDASFDVSFFLHPVLTISMFTFCCVCCHNDC